MPAGPWGGLRTEADERARGGVTVSSPPLRQLTCEQCGAILSYAPGTAELVCSYCGHRNRIVEATVEIVEQAVSVTENIGLGMNLDLTGCVSQVDESRLAVTAAATDPAGDPMNRVGLRAGFQPLVGCKDRRDVLTVRE